MFSSKADLVFGWNLKHEFWFGSFGWGKWTGSFTVGSQHQFCKNNNNNGLFTRSYQQTWLLTQVMSDKATNTGNSRAHYNYPRATTLAGSDSWWGWYLKQSSAL